MSDLKAVILAAGKGSRMKSEKPKVLAEIFSNTLLKWVLKSVASVNNDIESIVIVGHQADMVEDYLSSFKNVKTALQAEQLGTAHALAQAIPLLDDFCGNILLLCGDTPLLSGETLKNIVDYHKRECAAITVMSAKLDNPFGYGRIIRNEKNEVVSIVEQKDATDEQKTINEVNAGVYCFNWQEIKNSFQDFKNNNSQGEYYLTDIISWGQEKNKKVCGYVIENNYEILGINSMEQLEEATSIMNLNHLRKLMQKGVNIVDTKSTMISPETDIESDTIIFPNTYIQGENTIGKNCKIGPCAHLRGKVTIGDNCKIGNFVELKNAQIQNNTSISHLSYVGDATLGSNINIGAGTIFANYNSITKEKNTSTLKDGVSIGSNSVLVAPVELGENAFIAAGSVITKNVEENSLAMSRSPQKSIKDWTLKQKEQKQ